MLTKRSRILRELKRSGDNVFYQQMVDYYKRHPTRLMKIVNALDRFTTKAITLLVHRHYATKWKGDFDGSYKTYDFFSRVNPRYDRCSHEYDCCGCLFTQWYRAYLWGAVKVASHSRNY